MDLTFDDAIQHIKNSCYIVGYPTHDKQQETREKVNASLDLAIDAMHKYQKIQEIVKSWKSDTWTDGVSYDCMVKISEVLEDD